MLKVEVKDRTKLLTQTEDSQTAGQTEKYRHRLLFSGQNVSPYLNIFSYEITWPHPTSVYSILPTVLPIKCTLIRNENEKLSIN